MKTNLLPQLFSHQAECLESTIAELSDRDRCKIIMACGTGKTRVGSELALSLGVRSVVVYLPSLALVRQTLPEWLKAPFTEGIDYMCVCSDETVATFSDDAQVTIDDLVDDLGIERCRVTTDSSLIHEYLTRPCKSVRVVFCTYQSCDTLRNGLPNNFVFELGIFDEAHRTAGRNVAFSAPLNDSHTPISKRVFMTATPKHFDIRKRNKEGDAKVAFSMDDEDSYGRTAYKLPIRKAIELGIIAGYQVLVTVIDDKTIAHTLRNKSMGSAQHEAIAHAIAIKNAMSEYGLMKAVTFHDTVDNAAFFAEHELIRQELGIPTFHVSGQFKSKERSIIMSNFASAERGLVTNARCLTEGIDVPAIDLVAFLHPKKSQIDIIQAIGRALRKPLGSNKTTGFILLPLYVSDAENGGLEGALQEYGYDTIFQVIQALREQDEIVSSALARYKIDRLKNNSKGGSYLDFIKFSWAGNQVDWLRNVISTRIVDTLMESWYANYALLEKIHEVTGEANLGFDFVVDGVALGSWLSTQRKAFKDGILSSVRISLLDSLGFVWDVISHNWDVRYSLLKNIYEKTGDANISYDLVVDGVALGKWVISQRVALKSGKLAGDRKLKLLALGLVDDLEEFSWNQSFNLLARVFAETGDANVIVSFVAEGFKLGIWLNNQRSYYRKGILPTDRTLRLQSLGVRWHCQNGLWLENYSLLKKVFVLKGDVNVDINFEIDGVALGRWLNTQRMAYKLRLLPNSRRGKKSALTDERMLMLESLGVAWDIYEKNWDTAFVLLKDIFNKIGDANINRSVSVNGVKLGVWLHTQRKAFRKNLLSETRKSKLESIGVVLHQD